MSGDWPHKMLALQEAVHWAADRAVTVVFRDANAADSARQGRRPWATLALDSISAVGQDSVVREDVGSPATGQVEVYSGQRNFTVELRVMSREQALGEQAWYLADKIRTRLRRSSYARDRWFGPLDIAIVELGQVANMSPRVWDGRAESEAVVELMLATAVCDRSAENSGTWIETVLLSSTGLPDDLVNDAIS